VDAALTSWEPRVPLGGRRPGFAILDVETTGLDPARDEIVQVALLLVDDTRIAAWDSLVRPTRPVPPAILTLTGLDERALAEAAPRQEVAAVVARLLAGRPLVGHQIGFDLGFLAGWGIRAEAALDTLEWARVAFPRRAGHRLEDFQDLWPEAPAHFHDARTDVKACWYLLAAIRQRLLRLAPSDRALLAALLPREWHFLDVTDGPTDAPSAIWRPEPESPPVSPPPPTGPVRWAPGEWLGPGGALAGRHPDWESRPGQVTLSEAVDEALAERRVLVAEAATGIGKSLAYLLPALSRALDGERVVIATNTVALQDQLWQKDLPEALALFDRPIPVALMKGRARYLCLLKAEGELAGPQTELRSREEAVAFASLLVWLSETADGERDDWSSRLGPAAAAVWDRVAADREACAGARCRFAGPCFLRRSRRQAEASWLVVTNHAQLLSHAVQGPRGEVLPAFTHLIVDEAHRLPGVADQVLGFEVTLGQEARRLKEWGGAHSRLSHVRHVTLVPGAQAVKDRLEGLADALFGLETVTAAVLASYGAPGPVRATGPARDAFWARAGEIFREVQHRARSVREAMREWTAEARAALSEDEWNEPLWLSVRRLGTQLDALAEGLDQFLVEDGDWVDWWEVGSREVPTVTLRRAPLNPAPWLKEKLWASVPGGRVLLSATLTVGGRWNYFEDLAGLESGASHLHLPSPFAVDRQALLAIATDLPDPRDPEHLPHVARAVEALAGRTGGRMLVLTTSRQAAKDLDASLRAGLERQGLRLLTQGRDGPPRRLARMLAEQSGIVLLGTASLWEGIDVPGAALTTVVVTRLPFPYLGDPLEQARSEDLAARGQSAFRARSLPEAVLKFRQGFGRLLRTHRDFGAVVVLDPRCRPDRGGYGRVFVGSLPGPALTVAPVDTLVDAVARFVAEKLAEGER
jgi:ATP-dependent DNA helicase DinG